MVFLVACSGKTEKPGDQEKLEKVRIAEVTRSVFYTPQYVAIEKGFFKEEGIDIKLTTVWGGDKTMTALVSNGADVALVGSETSIYVSAQGSTDPVINFAQLTQTDGTFLVSREKIENFTWDQLKDTTFLGQRKGGMPQMAGEFVLKKHGINPYQDLNLIQNIDFANIANALGYRYKKHYLKAETYYSIDASASYCCRKHSSNIKLSSISTSSLPKYTLLITLESIAFFKSSSALSNFSSQLFNSSAM